MSIGVTRRLGIREYNLPNGHLEQHEFGGWLEQSYCTAWRVCQVVSRIASGARILLAAPPNWFECPPDITSCPARYCYSPGEATRMRR